MPLNSITTHSNDYASYKNRVISQNIVVSRDVELEGLQTVTYPDLGLPKKIKITSWIHGKPAYSIGTYDNGVQQGMMYYSELNHRYLSHKMVYIGNNVSNKIYASISNITKTSFDLNWIKVGTMTGGMDLLVELFY